MAYADGNYLTKEGRALIAKLMASESKIQFTKAAVGSGNLGSRNPADMTALAKQQAVGVISDISSPVAGEAQVVFQIFSKDVSVGFLATEAGVWAKDPDTGKEILYTYVVLAETPEWIRAKNDPVQKFAEFTCISVIGTVPVDETVINPEAIATLDYVKKHLANFVDLSAEDTPVVGTRVHLHELKEVSGYKPPVLTSPA